MGVPSSLKGRINLDKVSDVKCSGKEIQLRVSDKAIRMTSKRVCGGNDEVEGRKGEESEEKRKVSD